jgi:hypothetical protein
MGNFATKEWWGNLFSSKKENPSDKTAPRTVPTVPTEPTNTRNPIVPNNTRPSISAEGSNQEQMGYDSVFNAVKRAYIDWIKHIHSVITVRATEADAKTNNAGITNSVTPCLNRYRAYEKYIPRVGANLNELTDLNIDIDQEMTNLIKDLVNCKRQCTDKNIDNGIVLLSMLFRSRLYDDQRLLDSVYLSDKKRMVVLTNRYFYTVSLLEYDTDYLIAPYDPDLRNTIAQADKTALVQIIKPFVAKTKEIFNRAKDTAKTRRYNDGFSDIKYKIYINTIFEFNSAGKMTPEFQVFVREPTGYQELYSKERAHLASGKSDMLRGIIEIEKYLHTTFTNNEDVKMELFDVNNKYLTYVNTVGGLEAYNALKMQREKVEGFCGKDHTLLYQITLAVVIILLLLYVLYRR